LGVAVGKETASLVVEGRRRAVGKVEEFFLFELDVAHGVASYIYRMGVFVFVSARWLRVRVIVSGRPRIFLLHGGNRQRPHKLSFFGTVSVLELLAEATEGTGS
jgi:hypothetical protein